MNASLKKFLAGGVALQLAFVATCHGAEFIVIKPKYKADTIVAPDPEYPTLAKSQRHGGQGIFRLIINEKTGVVDEVQVFKGTGHGELNREAIMTLFKWRFKPGIKQRDVAISFEGVGRANELH
ncbi:MAG: hypothetical protein QOG48_2481 [Verrucomicrobiota bacterium]|jgi:TonB family protein